MIITSIVMNEHYRWVNEMGAVTAEDGERRREVDEREGRSENRGERESERERSCR